MRSLSEMSLRIDGIGAKFIELGMIRALLFIIALLAVARAEDGPLDLPEAGQRALVEKHLFPLLADADRVVIYSLYPIAKEYMEKDPDDYELVVALEMEDPGKVAKPDKTEMQVIRFARTAPLFEGYPVLGKVEIEKRQGAGEMVALLGKVRGSMLTAEEEPTEEDCFDPRHGMLIESGKTQLKFVICFSCGSTAFTGYPEQAKKGAVAFDNFSDDFEKYLNDRFKAAGVIHAPYKDNPPKAEK